MNDNGQLSDLMIAADTAMDELVCELLDALSPLTPLELAAVEGFLHRTVQSLAAFEFLNLNGGLFSHRRRKTGLLSRKVREEACYEECRELYGYLDGEGSYEHDQPTCGQWICDRLRAAEARRLELEQDPASSDDDLQRIDGRMMALQLAREGYIRFGCED